MAGSFEINGEFEVGEAIGECNLINANGKVSYRIYQNDTTKKLCLSLNEFCGEFNGESSGTILHLELPLEDLSKLHKVLGDCVDSLEGEQ